MREGVTEIWECAVSNHVEQRPKDAMASGSALLQASLICSDSYHQVWFCKRGALGNDAAVRTPPF